MRFNRRKLLQCVPPGLAALFLPRTVSVAGGVPKENHAAPLGGGGNQSVDVAIVGGGVAGCYTGWRLLNGDLSGSPLQSLANSNPDGQLDVGLFEYSGRIGGRLLSAELPPEPPGSPPGFTGPRKYAEFGGFRFQLQMHIVRDLATELGLSWEAFPVDEPLENFVYLRGRRFRRCQLREPAVTDLYNLRNSELFVLQSPPGSVRDFTTYVGNLAFRDTLGIDGYFNLRNAYKTAFLAEDWATAATHRQTFETAKLQTIIDGQPFTDWSWWALMSKYLSDEAIAYIQDTEGYNSLYSAGNAPTGLYENFYFFDEVDPATGTTWQHITTGYSDIPNKLYERFINLGGHGFLKRQLLRVDKSGSDYTLLFKNRQTGETETIDAKHVILAMPSGAIKSLDPQTFFLQPPPPSEPDVPKLLDSVLGIQAFRLFMAYERPWWTDAPPVVPLPPECQVYQIAPTHGRSTTDLPIRQLYYWHTEPGGGPSFVLASYCNAQAERYWQGLENGGQGLPTLDSLPGSVRDPSRYDGAMGNGPRSASMNMALLAHEQFKRLVGLENDPTVPEPYYAHFQNWSNPAWQAGWHVWKAGANEDNVIPEILQPLPNEKIYICGESYSNVQGWVQGALNTSEVMLQERLGVAYPDWLCPCGTWLGPGSDDTQPGKCPTPVCAPAPSSASIRSSSIRRRSTAVGG